MEKLGEILAKCLYQSRRELKLLSLKHGSLTTNRLSLFLIVLFAIVPLTLYFLFSGITYSIVQIVASYIFVTLLFGVSLLLVISWFKSEELFKDNVQGFSFVHLSQSRIDIGFFDFDDEDVENLLRMVNGLPAEQKIVIRETPKSKQPGNVRFIFTFLDLIVRKGISDMDTTPKESLNMLILERFTFQESEINPTTLPSSYSKWRTATNDGRYDEVRKDISKALGIL